MELLSDLTQNSANPIAAIELIALLVSVALWGRPISDKAIIGFVDSGFL